MVLLCFRRARLPCSQVEARSQGSQLGQLFMESLREVEANRQHLNPCGHKGCISFTRNTFLSSNRREAAPRNVALENPFVCKLGRYWGIGLQTWSEIKEFFPGLMIHTLLAWTHPALLLVLRPWRGVVPHRGGWPVSDSLRSVIMLTASVFT